MMNCNFYLLKLGSYQCFITAKFELFIHITVEDKIIIPVIFHRRIHKFNGQLVFLGEGFKKFPGIEMLWKISVPLFVVFDFPFAVCNEILFFCNVMDINNTNGKICLLYHFFENMFRIDFIFKIGKYTIGQYGIIFWSFQKVNSFITDQVIC